METVKDRIHEYDQRLKKLLYRIPIPAHRETFIDSVENELIQFSKSLTKKECAELMYFHPIDEIISHTIARYKEPFYLACPPDDFITESIYELFLERWYKKMSSRFDLLQKDLVLTKWKDKFVIQHTNVLIDPHTERVYGYVKDEQIYLDQNDQVQTICQEYDLVYEKK